MTITLTVRVALAAVDKMEGENGQDYLDRIADTATRYVNQSLNADNRIKVVSIRGAR